MERYLRTALLFGIGWGMAAALQGGAVAAADDAHTLQQADQSFVQAFGKADRAAARKLLDIAFTWTDATGKISTRALVLQNLGSATGLRLAIAGPGEQPKEMYKSLINKPGP